MAKTRKKLPPARDRIKQWRKEHRYSQRAFAKLIDVAHNNIYLIELGTQKVTPWMAEKLCAVMGGDWWDYVAKEDRQ